MSASRQRVIAHSAFPKWGRDVKEASKRAVAAGSRAGAEAAKAAVPVGDGESGVMPGHARDTITTLPIGKMKRGGYRAAFGSADPTILWLDKGTHGGRSTKIKGSSASAASREARRKSLRSSKSGRGTGIKAMGFMRRANKVALSVAIERLKIECARHTRYVP